MNTQTLESQWGRAPLTVAAEIPTVAIRFHLGCTHVGTSYLEVCRDTWAAMNKRPELYTRDRRRESLAATLWLHAENRAEYAGVMGGNLGA